MNIQKYAFLLIITFTMAMACTIDPYEEEYVLYGINFGPYQDEQDPNIGSYITENQIREHLSIVAEHAGWIKTFGCSDGLEQIPGIAKELGLNTAICAWLDSDVTKNQIQMENLMAEARKGNVDLAVIGSEVLLRNDLSDTKLIGYITQFRNEVPDIPVTTAAFCGELISHPNVMDACDVILANVYPFWDGIDIDSAVSALHARCVELRYWAGDKEIIISETGWPSEGDTVGDAVPSLENACYYFLNFTSWAQAEGVNYFYFEAFDEPWKANSEGSQGAHWGVWDNNRNIKTCMQDVFYGETVKNNWKCESMPGGDGEPEINFTYVPAIGSYDYLEGEVQHVYPDEYRIAIYIKVYSSWWTKPYWNNPLTVIDCDGSWICDYTTGGSDIRASEIIAFLLPIGVEPPSMSGGRILPGSLYENSVDFISVAR